MKKVFIKSIGIVVMVVSSQAMSAGYAPWVGVDLNGIECRGGIPGSGPYDYRQRTSLTGELKRVERRHFTQKVEQLISGESTKDVMSDLDYTLRQWPNHHRALYSMIEYQIRESKKYSRRKMIPAECYLQRAEKFSNKDITVMILYALYLHRSGHLDLALKKYEEAEGTDENNMQLKYNYALLLVDLGKFDEAKEKAEFLYSKNFPLEGLKKRLSKAGHWNDE